MRDLSRDDLLALTPERYLVDGYLDDAGRTRRELKAEYATAAATQLLVADASPQELSFTYEALRQVLALEDDDDGAAAAAGERIGDALDEALEVVERMIGQANNEGLETWLRRCASRVTKPADIDAMLEHVQATLRQYAVFAAMPAPDGGGDGSSAAAAPSSSPSLPPG